MTLTDSSNGTWYYSINNGGAWSSFTAAPATSRLLAADANTRLYFQPNPNFNGTVATGISFRAWDQTSGSNGGTANTSTNGGDDAALRQRPTLASHCRQSGQRCASGGRPDDFARQQRGLHILGS